jgi:pyruvate dehydrogenase E2 component (dihydrolipoamide acetyltransferase)
MPNLGMYTEDGVLTTWLRPAGAHVEMGEPIAEITTEKVTFEVQSPAAGLLHRVAEVGTSLQVQSLLGYILAEGEAIPAEGDPKTSSGPEQEPVPHELAAVSKDERPGGTPKASPAARRLAAQNNVDLNQLKGSGPGGRIVEADVLTEITQRRK